MAVFEETHGCSPAARLLSRVDEILHHDISPSSALGLILKVVAEGLGADSSCLLLPARERAGFAPAASFGPQQAHPGLVSSLSVPVYLDGACIGVLRLTGRLFAEPDLALLRQVSARIALLAECLRLQAQVSQSARAAVPPAGPKPTDLREVLETAVSVLRCEFKRYDAQLDRDLEPVPRVLCDPEELERAFINLLLESLRSLEGRPERRVGLRTRWRGQSRRVELELRDTGGGIGAEPLVKDAVERHGGTVSILSSPPAGTVVRVDFPLDGRGSPA